VPFFFPFLAPLNFSCSLREDVGVASGEFMFVVPELNVATAADVLQGYLARVGHLDGLRSRC
jgi:hypothetical protein